MGDKVDNECCNVDNPAWAGSLVALGAEARTPPNDASGNTTTCYARAIPANPDGSANGGYVRNYLGCFEGLLTAGENCVPEGITYPMNESSANSESVDGDLTSCGCTYQYGGAESFGCYVAKPEGDLTTEQVTFLKLGGKVCPLFASESGVLEY